MDQKLVNVKRENELMANNKMVKVKQEIQGSSDKTRKELSIDILKLKEELTESFRNELNKIKTENL